MTRPRSRWAGLRKLLNVSESVTRDRLAEVAGTWGACVYAKIRLADVFPVDNSGLPDHLYKFALMSHFDFVVANDKHDPLFAVEFDGPSHRSRHQRLRDQKKNDICDYFHFPILRINARYLDADYGDIDVLAWFVHCWFATEWLTQAQLEGHFPADEPIIPSTLLHIPGQNKDFPLHLGRKARQEVLEMHSRGLCSDWAPGCWIGTDQRGNYHAIGYLKVDAKRWIKVESGMRAQRFPALQSDILQDITDHEVYQTLLVYLADGRGTITAARVDARLAEFDSRYQMAAESSRGVGAT